MKLFLLFIDDNKYKQYSTMKDALKNAEIFIAKFPELKINIYVDEFDDFGHSDACCKRHLLYCYINNKIEKFIDYE